MKFNTTDILNEIEKDKLLAFKEDKVTFEAVKKYVLYHLYQDGVPVPGLPHEGHRNWALRPAFGSISGENSMTNEQLGENIRSLAYAVQIIESGFKEIGNLTDDRKKDEPKEANPAE